LCSWQFALLAGNLSAPLGVEAAFDHHHHHHDVRQSCQEAVEFELWSKSLERAQGNDASRPLDRA
jgi:hypothetical protein